MQAPVVVVVAALLAVVAPAPPAGAQQQPVRIDGLAALVGGLEPAPGVDVILQSDVELYALIELSGDVSGLLPTTPLPEALMRAALQKLVGEYVIAREAERVRVSEPRVSDITRERRRLELRAGGRERLRALLRDKAVSKRELESILLRRARVSAFLRANLETDRGTDGPPVEQVPVAERPDGQKPGGSPQSKADGDRSQESTLQKAAERWIRMLMVRTPVRMFGEYSQ